METPHVTAALLIAAIISAGVLLHSIAELIASENEATDSAATWLWKKACLEEVSKEDARQD